MSAARLPAIILATMSALLWGLWWIPIRYLAEFGIHDLWGGLLMSAVIIPPLLLVLWLRPASAPLSGKALLGAACVGAAVTTYSTAVNLSDVVRVILLFYLAPAWSKLIETWFLGIKWQRASSIALVLSLSGGVMVLGGGISVKGLNLGDLLALLSGLCWAIGAALIFSGGKADAIKLTLTTALSACVIGILGAMAFSAMLAVDDIANALPSVAIGGLIYVLPILLVTMWSAQILPPALLSFLLTAEILSGVLSGVILLSAPFAGFQAVGAMFIIAGAAVELVLSRAIPSETTTENVGNSG